VRTDPLLKTDSATLAIEATKDGKIRVNAKAWPETKVILKGEVLEAHWIDGQVRVARKQRLHDAGDRPIGPHELIWAWHVYRDLVIDHTHHP